MTETSAFAQPTVELIDRTENSATFIAYFPGQPNKTFRIERTAPRVWNMTVAIPGVDNVWASICTVATPADAANAFNAFLTAPAEPGAARAAAVAVSGRPQQIEWWG